MSKSGWTLLFAAIFVLSQDYLLFVEWPAQLFGGLPVWMFYFIAVHVIFIVAIYRLAINPLGEA